jgi:D-erythritol 1-phosphate dehydrogenase
MPEPLDLFIIGGGINGAGIARDAAGRGLRVVLCEKGDLAEGTSSRSSKLIHGGLRYLEYYEFRLVREALIEREVLLSIAPHIIRPMRFVLPHSSGQRPVWLLRTGLFLYDHLAGRRTLPATRRIDLQRAPEGEPLRADLRTAFAYSDCWVDDARLVVLNALDAHNRGAELLLRHEAVRARREGGLWTITVRAPDGGEQERQAKVLVNAAGPWVDHVLDRVIGLNAAPRVRLVKGSHLVVRKFWQGTHAYLLQNKDSRVVFVIPYEDDLCLIGTTDVAYDDRPETVAIDSGEHDYLLRAVNVYTRYQLAPPDVLHTFSGVRPLYDDRSTDPSAVTRDYVFDMDGTPPVLSVFGGKITTYRKLAEHALRKLAPVLEGMRPAWTASVPLPGGDMGIDFDAWLETLRARYRWLPRDLARHYARLYGTRAEQMLDGTTALQGLGHHFGGRLYEREADFLIRTEWARQPDDVLERRTKHYLHMTPAECDAFAAWMALSASRRDLLGLGASG